MPLLPKSQWCEVALRLMGTDGVVHPFVVQEIRGQLGYGLREIRRHLVELLSMSAVGPLHMAIEFGALGR